MNESSLNDDTNAWIRDCEMQEETKKREAAEVHDFNKQLTEDITNHDS